MNKITTITLKNGESETTEHELSKQESDALRTKILDSIKSKEIQVTQPAISEKVGIIKPTPKEEIKAAVDARVQSAKETATPDVNAMKRKMLEDTLSKTDNEIGKKILQGQLDKLE